MSFISNITNLQTRQLLNLSPVTNQNVTVILPQQLSVGVSPPGLQATVQDLFEARFKQSLSQVSSSAQTLSAAATSLTPSNPAFTKRATASSDPDVAVVQAQNGSGLGSLDLEVQQLASPQENEGIALDAEASGSFDAGRQFFDLNVGESTTRLSVFVDPSDTHIKTLGDISTAINNADTAVSASVEINEASNQAQLKIQSSMTGTGSSFSLEDTLGSVVLNSGANSVASEAQNALIKINGDPQQIETNSFHIDTGRVLVTLGNKPGTASLNISQDADALVSAVKDFVSKTNQFRKSLAKAEKTLTPDIAGTFDQQVSLVRESLGKIGVSVDMSVVLSDFTVKDSALRVDEQALELAIETNPAQVEELLAGPGGLAARIGSIAEAVETSSAIHLIAKPQYALSFFGAGVGRDTVTGVLLNAMT